MYNPARYANSADADLIELVRAHPFATVITLKGGEAKVSHLPLLLEVRGEQWMLVGHMARANDHWRSMEGNPTRVIFHGPHAYVTPTWYQECDVPTWNYAVAHFLGKGSLLEGRSITEAALRSLSAAMEGPGGWEFSIPEDLAGAGVLEKAIVAFEIKVEERHGKFKLSQNRSQEDFQGVLRGLATRKDDQSLFVRQWMERIQRPAP